MILFIGQQFSGFFGGGVITQRNLSMCKEVFGENYVKTYLLPPRKGGIHTIKEFATGYMMGLTKNHEAEILSTLRNNAQILYVFIDYSLLGILVKRIKQQFPKVKILVFFHNVEIVYFSSFLITSRRLHHVIGLPATILNERNSVKYADTIITLNERDSTDLKRWYNRHADLTLPTSLPDLLDQGRLEKRRASDPVILLFVGSRFFPNEQGMNWFIKKIIPYTPNAKLYIVGKGFEDLKNDWDSDQVEVIGSSDDLSPYYYRADIVVAPIFTGSGMKTKIAEALMYGKTVLGTNEAFEGYEMDYESVGSKCNSDSDFISFINNYKSESVLKYNEQSRKVFNEQYNEASIISNFTSFLKTSYNNAKK